MCTRDRGVGRAEDESVLVMKEHIKILNEFKKHPLSVLENEKDNAKLMAAINKSIKMLQKQNSKNKSSYWR